MIIETIRIILGIALLFVPGYCLTPLSLRGKGIRNLCVSFGVSCAYLVGLGLLLTFLGNFIGKPLFTFPFIVIPTLFIVVIKLMEGRL